MVIYVAGDADGAGGLVGQAQLADNKEELAILSNHLNAGNDLWKKWAESHGGNAIEIGGDQFIVEVEADYLEEIPKLKEQYEGLVGATLTIGIGTKMSDATKALIAGKLSGKDQIKFYSPECDKIIAQDTKQDEKSKLSEEFGLNKAVSAENKGAGAGFEGFHPASAPVVAKPEGPQGEHSEAQDVYNLLSEERPAGPEMTHAAKDMEDQLHDHAWKGEEEDMKQGADKHKSLSQVKEEVANALKILQTQAPMLQEIRMQAPDVYKAMLGLTQSVIKMARELAPAPVKKSEESSSEESSSSESSSSEESTKAELSMDHPHVDGKDLNKAKLPMPKAPAHRHVILPVGSEVDQKIKNQHSDGSTSWQQMKAGKILGQDAAGHPVSSRNPNGR